jgi:hypothetical protein
LKTLVLWIQPDNLISCHPRTTYSGSSTSNPRVTARLLHVNLIIYFRYFRRTSYIIRNMSDYQISEEGCPLWNNGFRCKASETTGCPHVHDNFLRKEAQEKKRLENLKKRKEQKLAVSRSQLQGQYNSVLAAKTPNIPTANRAKPITSIKVANTAQANTAQVNTRMFIA